MSVPADRGPAGPAPTCRSPSPRSCEASSGGPKRSRIPLLTVLFDVFAVFAVSFLLFLFVVLVVNCVGATGGVAGWPVGSRRLVRGRTRSSGGQCGAGGFWGGGGASTVTNGAGWLPPLVFQRPAIFLPRACAVHKTRPHGCRIFERVSYCSGQIKTFKFCPQGAYPESWFVCLFKRR